VADKDIIIGRVINVAGMIGVSAGIVWLSELYCSYFGVALASILQTPFTGFGSWWRGPLHACGSATWLANNSEIKRGRAAAYKRTPPV
jgi:hypothetical protein